jgi:hypothetical protein
LREGLNYRDIIRVMTFWDKVLILLLSGLTIFSFYIVKTLFPKGAEAAVEVEERRLGPYPLTEDRVLEIRGLLGDTEIEIKDGKIRVIKAPCRDKICIKQGWISHSGEAIICLPNRVMVYVSGESRYDAITW